MLNLACLHRRNAQKFEALPSPEQPKKGEIGISQVKIELLYVPDCPHHSAALVRLREVLAAEGVSDEVQEVAVTDSRMARALRFCGSPTIRVNGQDIAGPAEESAQFAVSCRLYPGSEQTGVPPVEMIRCAVRTALGRANA
jgi:hypothetical protein